MDDDIEDNIPPATPAPQSEPEPKPGQPAPPKKVISAEKAMKYAAALEMFAEFHGAASITVIHLQDLRDLAGKVRRQHSRQLTVDSFFLRTGI